MRTLPGSMSAWSRVVAQPWLGELRFLASDPAPESETATPAPPGSRRINPQPFMRAPASTVARWETHHE